MRRMSRREAERERRAVRTVREIDYLLMVDDEARQGRASIRGTTGWPIPAGA
jgi:serine/threonine-protein kinase HipA